MALGQLLGPAPRRHLRQGDREQQHRRGEDDRDDAGHVDAQRQVGALAAVDLAPHHPLGVLHRDAALPFGDVDDERHHEHGDDAHEHPVAGVQGEQLLQAAGSRDTMLAKIMSEMPLPMPRWVISSPSHMTRAVPTVRVRTTRKKRSGVQRRCPAGRRRSSCEQEDEADGLDQGQDHGEVAGVLVDLLLPGLALFHERFQLRDHHGQQLHDDRRRDVRHDAHGEDGHALQAAAGEEVVEVEDPAGVEHAP